jgi:hypothetical protein
VITLFDQDDSRRTNMLAAPERGSEYVYLNTSARPVIRETREMFESWFSRYPKEDGKKLNNFLTSFKSSSNKTHLGAFFELLLHELLLRLGCSILAVEPDIAGATTHPDFKVASSEGEEFYIEATIATGMSPEDESAQDRENTVYDIINQMDSPNFFLSAQVKGHPNTSPPAAKIRGFLKEELSKLDPDEVTDVMNSGGGANLPTWLFEHDGWSIEFSPMPKSPDARGKDQIRTIGIRFHTFKSQPEVAIRDAVIRKAKHYGKLDLPFVIAVYCTVEGQSIGDVYEALMGSVGMIIDHDSREPSVRGGRILNGAWIINSGPVYTRNSAVLAILGGWHGQIARQSCLFYNPYAANPLRATLSPLPRCVPENRNMEYKAGKPVNEILGWVETSPSKLRQDDGGNE